MSATAMNLNASFERTDDNAHRYGETLEARIMNILASLSKKAGVDWKPVVTANDAMKGRLAMVLMNWLLVDPEGMKQLSDEELEAVLAHELGHVAHHDVAKKMVCICLQTGGGIAAAMLVSGVLLKIAVYFAAAAGVYYLVTCPIMRNAERRADAFAAKYANKEALANVLESVAPMQSKAVKFVEKFRLAEYPTLASRIARLRK